MVFKMIFQRNFLVIVFFEAFIATSTLMVPYLVIYAYLRKSTLEQKKFIQNRDGPVFDLVYWNI